MPVNTIPFPSEFRPVLPTIVGNVDYQTLREQLEHIEFLLGTAGIEMEFVSLSLEHWIPKGKTRSARQQQKFQERSRRALRCNVLRTLLQEDYRNFSCQLAGNPLYQWFCLIDAIDKVRVPSKSELQRFSHWLPSEKMRLILTRLLQSTLERPKQMKLKTALDLDEYFLDTTCLKANIHFPVDWVLLRDGVRTLMKATKLIREQGLKGRMQEPEVFLRKINRLCMEMTHQRRQENSRKQKKKILRAMKKVVSTVRAHAKRHRELLDKHWEETDWTRPRAEQVIKRIDHILELLPKAQKQAHERIIGGRLVANKDKILSLYETEARVVVRGKAEAEVEFGNKVLLGENRQGLILDFQLYRDNVPADTTLLAESLERIVDALKRKVGAVVADRGFAAASNNEGLKEAEIFDAICPRQPLKLKERMKEPRFARLQKRRSQTEGRIGIIKQNFFGKPMRAKGFVNRELAVCWAILTHNLWKLAHLCNKKVKMANPLRKAA